MANIIKILGVLLLAVLGIGFIGGGTYFGNQVNQQLNSGIQDSLVVDGPDDPDYPDFLNNTEADDPPKYKKFYFWNLTNPDEYLSGADPIYNEIGPYVYRQFDVKFDVSFSGDEVTYKTYTYYVFEEDLSDGSVTDLIININPAYQGILAQAGSENAFVTGFVGPTIETIIDTAKGEFLTSVVYQAQGPALASLLDNLKNDFVPNVITSAVVDVMSQIKEGVIENFYASINASVTANVVNQTVIGLGAVIGNTTAWNDYFNSVSFSSTYSLGLQGISEYINTVSGSGTLSFSTTAMDRIINGTATLPGWFDDFQAGFGVLNYLLLYLDFLANNSLATLAGNYGMVEAQLNATVGYLLDYAFTLLVPVITDQEYGSDPQTLAEFNFYTQWANASIVPTGLDINDDQVTPDGFEAGIPTPLGIDHDTAIDLFNSSIELSFMNSTRGVFAWYDAEQGNDTTKTGLQLTFGLTNAQMELLLTWFGNFRELVTQPLVLANFAPFGVNDPDDLAFLHWANPVVTGGESLVNLTQGLEGIPELWAYSKTFQGGAVYFDVDRTKTLLDGPFGLFNGSNVLQFFTWLAEGNTSMIATTWGLNSTEVSILAGYLQYFNATFATPGIISTFSPFGVEVLSDLVYLHWGTPYLTQGISLKELDPTLSGYPEFWAYASNIASSTLVLDNVTVVKQLLSSSGFYDSTKVGLLLVLVQAGDFNTVQALFNLNSTQALLMAGYFEYLKSTFVTDVLTPLIELGGGLLSTRTVEEWLWESSDPMLAFLKEQVDPTIDTSSNLFANYTSISDARIPPASTFNTGADDISKINQYIKWRGMDEVTIWKSVEKVQGTDATQFAPGVQRNQVLTAWVSDLMRSVDFVYDSDVFLYDILMYRFKLSPATLDVNPNYYQSTKGLANMTASVGIPLFLSKPHFLDSSLTSEIGASTADVELHDTFIDVEPTTGAVMNAAKRLQLNLYISSARVDYFNPNIKEHYMPLLWVEESGTIPEDSAAAFVDKVYGAQSIENFAEIGGPIIGSIFLLLAMFIAVPRPSRP